jgi:hypothetical protein
MGKWLWRRNIVDTDKCIDLRSMGNWGQVRDRARLGSEERRQQRKR